METFSERIVGWYKEHKRDLPWRETKDPYKIWVSEIILQQTRVAQGYDYYCRFIERFPDVGALAGADEDEVMRYWQGLGYYSRARNLHEAARTVVAQGGFPTTYEGVRALKGVGDYTAAAICSFAYGMPYAAVDGNVYRVLSRWMGVEEPIDTAAGRKLFAALAGELLDKERPGIYNQAIMDFGALQCVPSSPDCLSCVLADSCVARQKNMVDMLPGKRHKAKIANRFFSYIYVHTDTCAFIRKRVHEDIWQNLYEFPLIETGRMPAEGELVLMKEFQELFSGLPTLEVRLLRKGVKHVLSHQIIRADLYEVKLPEGARLPDEEYRQVRIKDLHNFPVSRLVSHFFSLILGSNSKR